MGCGDEREMRSGSGIRERAGDKMWEGVEVVGALFVCRQPRLFKIFIVPDEEPERSDPMHCGMGEGHGG